MSHSEYVAACDEGQLESLIEHANGRLSKIRASGFVSLWTVSIGWGNVAWFAEADYEAAIDYACTAAKAQSIKRPSQGVEMEVSLERYRPGEVVGLLARTPSPKESTQ